MADTLTTTTQIDPAVSTYYDRKLLVRAKPYQIYTLFGQQRDLPAKSGNTIKFRRYTNLSTATIPLAEGIEPNGQRLAKTDITATPKQYGDFVHSTDVVDLTVEDKVLNETADLMAQQFGETIDELTRDVLAACSSYTDASNGSNGDVPTEITVEDIDAVKKTLRGNDARYITPLIRAGTGQGTSPIRPAFWAMTDVDIEDDIEKCTGFKSTANYPAQQSVLEAEIGNVKNVRFLTSSIGYVDSGASNLSADEYYVIIIGQYAYGLTKIKRGEAKWIYHEPKIAGGALEQYWTAGWKTWFIAKILNSNFMHVLRVTHS